MTPLGAIIFFLFIHLAQLVQCSQQQQYQTHQHQHHQHHHQQQQQPRPPNIKILIPNLPPHQYQFWLKNHPKAFENFKEVCTELAKLVDQNGASDVSLEKFQHLHKNLHFEDLRYLRDVEYGRSILEKICSKIDQVTVSCWGYEHNCQEIHMMPDCSGVGDKAENNTDHHDDEEQKKKIRWFVQADFGYILNRRKELSRYCWPDRKANYSIKSSLECTKYFRTCRGENLYVQFEIPKQIDFETEGKGLFKEGQIGGWNCDLQLKRIKEEGAHSKRLQSWFSELKRYNLIRSVTPEKACDVTIDEQVFFLKLDSTSDMYDYFGNFLNLYATIHLNNRFSEDNHIVIWDHKVPQSKFEQIWYAFSKNRPRSIGEFNGKRVCFKRFIFALPPRSVGGFYRDPPKGVAGCSKSGLFDAFSKHVLHKLGIPQLYNQGLHSRTKNNLIRITILSDQSSGNFTNFIIQLESSLRLKSKSYFVQLLHHDLDFAPSLGSILNTDIFIGTTGPALTYTLFLPDWATLMELQSHKNTKYKYLANVRGVNYVRREMIEPTKLDVEPFVDEVTKVAEIVKKRREGYFRPNKGQAKVVEGHLKADQTENTSTSTPAITTTTTTASTTTSTATSTSTTTMKPPILPPVAKQEELANKSREEL